MLHAHSQNNTCLLAGTWGQPSPHSGTGRFKEEVRNCTLWVFRTPSSQWVRSCIVQPATWILRTKRHLGLAVEGFQWLLTWKWPCCTMRSASSMTRKERLSSAARWVACPVPFCATWAVLRGVTLPTFGGSKGSPEICDRRRCTAAARCKGLGHLLWRTINSVPPRRHRKDGGGVAEHTKQTRVGFPKKNCCVAYPLNEVPETPRGGYHHGG